MNLSDSLYRDICTALGLHKAAARAGKAGDEFDDPRRKSPRHPVKADVEVEPLAVVGGTRWTVRVTDLSTSGLGFTDGKSHAPNDRVVVHLPRGNGSFVPLTAIVRNSRLVGRDTFQVGAQFVSRAEFTREGWADETTGLPEEFPGPTGTAEPGGRAVARVPVCSHATLHLYRGEDAGPVVEAKLVDCSVNGVGFTCGAKLEPNARFMLWVEEPGRRPFGRFCTVTNCRQITPGKYRVGAKFVGKRPPPPQGKEKLLTRLFHRDDARHPPQAPDDPPAEV